MARDARNDVREIHMRGLLTPVVKIQTLHPYRLNQQRSPRDKLLHLGAALFSYLLQTGYKSHITFIPLPRRIVLGTSLAFCMGAFFQPLICDPTHPSRTFRYGPKSSYNLSTADQSKLLGITFSRIA